MKVLLVDPRESSRDALRRALAAAGGPVRGFAGLPEAEAALSDFFPDVVVVALDAGDGAAAFLRRAREGDPRRMVLALVDLSDLDRAVASGADDFLWRPVSEPRVEQLLAAARARRAAADD